ncbi:MAG: YbdK family carboxylate-amine ligase [Chromatiaceae bacterium]
MNPNSSTVTHPKRAKQKTELLEFQPSERNSLGVELELQIIDPRTGDLAPGSARILKLCDQEDLEDVTAELMQSMIEVKTGICQNVQEVKDQIWPLMRKVSNLAGSLGYDLALGGTHPFNRGLTSVVFPAERYERIQERLAWLTYQRVVFGLHVHIGVPNGDIAIGVINTLVRYLSHLVALSASSPFWHGEDTGLASARSVLYRMLPHAGVPRYFRNWKEFQTFYQVLRDCEAIQSPKDIYWDIRPRPYLGTIEFRVCDMPASLAVTLGIVALIRTLVISTQRFLQERRRSSCGDIRHHWLAIENKWLATRYGLQAMHIRQHSGKRRLLSRDLTALIKELRPIAIETGDAPFLDALCPLESFESGADWQRRLFRESGDWKRLVDDMTQRLAQELRG